MAQRNPLSSIPRMTKHLIPHSEMPVPEVGTEIYYTGDRANIPGDGYIGQVKETKWGINITVQLNDGRRFIVSPASFHPSPGRRFWTRAEWDTQREAQIQAFINS